MEQITIELTTEVAIALAIAQGWQPVIEDTTQPLNGDEYPKIPNPVTYKEYIKRIAPAYLSDIVLRSGRQKIIDEFSSIYDSIDHGIKNGQFDELILAGDFDGIKSLVRSQL